jgi:hypothetical protein
VTLFGIFLTPVFYFVIQWFKDRPWSAAPPARLRPSSGGGDGHAAPAHPPRPAAVARTIAPPAVGS